MIRPTGRQVTTPLAWAVCAVAIGVSGAALWLHVLNGGVDARTQDPSGHLFHELGADVADHDRERHDADDEPEAELKGRPPASGRDPQGQNQRQD